MNLPNPVLVNRLRSNIRSSGVLFKSPTETLLTPPAPLAVASLAAEPIEHPAETVWKKAKKLGTYSLVEAEISPTRRLRVITHAQRFRAKIQSFLESRQEKSLTLASLTEWLKGLQGSLAKASYAEPACAPTVLLEDLVLRKNSGLGTSIGQALLAQLCLENFSRIESRVVFTAQNAGHRFYLLVKVGKSKFFLFDPESGEIDASLAEKAEIQTVAVKPHTVVFGKDRRFSLFNNAGDELVFQVIGRTPAENRFQKEAELIAAAADEELVPIEIGFHPFWRRYGHTTLRIGESLYEFSSDGWRAHNTGADSARAYLFNNPFFKSRLSVFSPSGMPPISFAVSREIKAATVRALQKRLDEKCALQGRGREKFNLFLSNCNQKLRGVLRDFGIPGFEERGFFDFSSVLSFNQLLNSPAPDRQRYWVYPLPNTDVTEENLRNWFPRVLYLHNTPGMERRRAIRSVLTDVGVGIAVLVNKFTMGLLRWRVWRGHDEYQHINDQW